MSHPWTAEYLVILTGRELRGRIMGQDVYRATDFDILPLNPNVTVYNPPHPVEGHLLALLRSHLFGGFFLFSYGFDITRRLQVQFETEEQVTNKGLWEVVRTVCSCTGIPLMQQMLQADDRFFWNRSNLSVVLKNRLLITVDFYSPDL